MNKMYFYHRWTDKEPFKVIEIEDDKILQGKEFGYIVYKEVRDITNESTNTLSSDTE